MISQIRGTIETVGPGWVNLHIGVCVLKVIVPNSIIYQGLNGQVRYYHTHLRIYNEQLVLYGFVTQASRELFLRLIGVTRVGVNLALALMSDLSDDDLVQAISNGSVPILTSVPGVGKQTANRIILELKNWKYPVDNGD